MAPVTRKRNQAAKGKQCEDKKPDAKPAPKKRARPAPKPSKTNKKQRGDDRQDEDTDVGTNSSRDLFVSSIKGLKGIKETRKEMRKKADEVIEFIEQQLRKKSQANNRPAAMDCLPPDTASFLLHTTAPTPTPGSEIQNTTFKKAQECLAGFQTLVKDYEAMNRGSNDVKEPTWMQWEQDIKNLTALNKKTMEIAFRTLNSVVMPNAKVSIVEDRVKGSDDIEALAQELLAEAKPQRGQETWGTVAHGFLRAFSEAVSLLPKETRS